MFWQTNRCAARVATTIALRSIVAKDDGIWGGLAIS
jgi:hypothetical protein